MYVVIWPRIKILLKASHRHTIGKQPSLLPLDLFKFSREHQLCLHRKRYPGVTQPTVGNLSLELQSVT